MEISIAEMQNVLGGELRMGCPPPRDGEMALTGTVVTDSRQVRPGDVFWALSGATRNGADFADDALRRGAQGVIVSQRRVEPWAGTFVLEVPESKLALWQLADWNRRRCEASVIAVTGSVGKTTTRQMIDTVLRPAGDGMASPQNYNNDIGVPLSLLSMLPEHDYAVIELAATARGEIDALARLAAPQIGVITRIGDAHLGKFGSPSEIAAAKGELLGALGRQGQAVLCGDDPWQRRLAAMSPVSVLWYGRSGECDLSAVEVRHGDGQLTFRIERQQFCLPVWGRHHLEPALAAVAVGLLYGRTLAETAEALAEFQPVPMRCEVRQHRGVTIINDAYNSSPLAAEAALKLLGEYPATGRRIALMGDMGDLGMYAESLHEQLGRHTVTAVGLDALWACGDHANDVVAGAIAAGMSPSRAVATADPLDCIAPLRHQLVPGDVLLVKGARVMQLERVVEALGDQPLARAA